MIVSDYPPAGIAPHVAGFPPAAYPSACAECSPAGVRAQPYALAFCLQCSPEHFFPLPPPRRNYYRDQPDKPLRIQRPTRQPKRDPLRQINPNQGDRIAKPQTKPQRVQPPKVAGGNQARNIRERSPQAQPLDAKPQVNHRPAAAPAHEHGPRADASPSIRARAVDNATFEFWKPGWAVYDNEMHAFVRLVNALCQLRKRQVLILAPKLLHQHSGRDRNADRRKHLASLYEAHR